MPSRSSKPKDHDFTRTALRVVEQAIGEKWDGSPLLDKDAGKNPAAVALGKLGGAKGGKARAAALSPRKRYCRSRKENQNEVGARQRETFVGEVKMMHARRLQELQILETSEILLNLTPKKLLTKTAKRDNLFL